jgi:hypothetical protein
MFQIRGETDNHKPSVTTKVIVNLANSPPVMLTVSKGR